MSGNRRPARGPIRVSAWVGLGFVALALVQPGSATAQESGSTAPATGQQATGQQAGSEQAGGEAGGPVVLRHPLDNEPLDVPLPEGDKLTEAVQTFHQSGENIYVGDEQATADGKKLYQRYCQSCHMPDATGRMGPSLVDEQVRYPRNNTPIGMFETTYAGAAGAMQSFAKRMSQDEILKVVAFVQSLRSE